MFHNIMSIQKIHANYTSSCVLLYNIIYTQKFPNLFVLSYRYEVMLSCWSIDPAERPKFSNLVKILGFLLERDSGYLDLSDDSAEYLSRSQSLSWKNSAASPLPTVEEEEEEIVDDSEQEGDA